MTKVRKKYMCYKVACLLSKSSNYLED